MLSVLQPNKVYPIVEDICEHDLNQDVDEYNYDGRTVFRGNKDPMYSTNTVDVYWLYEDVRRVGLVEHSVDTHVCLWFGDNPFSSLLQEDWTAQDKTIWSLMSNEAYEDCMKYGWTTMDQIRSRTKLVLVTPKDIETNTVPASLNPCSTLFVDEDGVVYTPPTNTILFHGMRNIGTGQE